MKLFTYGSLKTGYWNNRILEGATSLGKAVTKKPYTLVDVGFPYALTQKVGHPQKPIIGEVFEIDDNHLLRCDRLEGHPNHYVRRKVLVHLTDLDEEVETFIYEYDGTGRQASLCQIDDNGYYYWAG